MKSNRMSKLSAGIFVLVMTLSAVGVLPLVGQAQTPTSKNIYIPVGSSGVAVTNAYVNLTDVHTGEVIAATYSSQSSSYVVTNAPSGYYRVDVVHQDYYDQLDAAEFKFDGFSNYTVSPPISLQAFPFKGYSWNVTVTDTSGNPIPGALVGFYNPNAREFVAKATTDVNGNVVFSMFDTGVVLFDLVVMKATKAIYTNSMAVNGNGLMTIPLSPSHRVTGFAADEFGPADNVVAYLINQDDAVHWEKRVLKSLGSFVSFDAYDGTFTLVVDADGDSAYVSAVTVSGADISLGTLMLAQQTQTVEQVNLAFGVDFNVFTLSVSTLWSYDDAYPGLLYNDIGSLRAQVDLILGDGNGALDSTEVGDFRNLVEAFGTQYVSSFGLIDVNNTVYSSASSITGYTEDLAAGAVTDTTAVNYAYTCVYSSHSAIYVGAEGYTADLVARYDSSSVNYSYSIALVNDYELVQNSSTSQVAVSGYETVVVEPTLVSTGGKETVGMTLEKSTKPIAMSGIVASSYAYAVMDDLNVSRYLVRVGQNVTLTASGSEDPNGNPLTYTWDFGDGSPVEQTRNVTIVHNYTSAANLVANLTVADVTGRLNWSDVNVTCDNLGPRPDLKVKDKHVNLTDNSITVNQRESVTFNGTDSLDDAVAVGDALGVVDFYQLEWGDGNKSNRVQMTADQKNVSWNYERAGVYVVILNVTDVVGHSTNTTTLTVRVNDTDVPTLSMAIKNETYGTNLVENTTLIFDANGTHDNVDDINSLTFSWDFGDGNWNNDTGFNTTTGQYAWNVTHNYTKTGQITVKLNVTDLSGNYKVDSRLINVQSSPRPNMIIDAITFDPEKFTEGSGGTIIVNLTNKGSANATNIQLSFYIVEKDGTQKLIGTSTTVTLNGTTKGTLANPVAVGETVQCEFSWSPSTKGTYTIRVNVTSEDQLRQSSKSADITVKQAAWKQIALWGGVAAIIILVPLLLYLRGRWAKREKKGPRREKKEKAGSEEEL